MVIDEDRSMITALQKGFSSPGFDPGPISRFEHPARHLIQTNLDKISSP